MTSSRRLKCQKSQLHKKVLLRERKSYTARHVASTRCAALSPQKEVPTLDGQVPTLDGGAYLG